MNAQLIISMAGAIALFLYGMSTMTDGLAQLSSGRLERVLEKLTDNVFKGILMGALVTAVIHSSATTTVMCVGFVNAGIMKLEQTVGIIMGANIGTTVTAQILRLSSIEGTGDNLILTLLQPSVLGPLMAVGGIIFYMFLKGGVRKNIGQVLLGMGMLFIGMNTMTQSVAPLQNEPWLQDLFTAFSNPLLGMVVGAAITALLQSSTAFTGILQALSTTGAVRFNTAIPLIMGQNIGTTLTALLSSAGASKNAKRTALIHFIFNVVGSLFFLVVLYAGNALFSFPFWTDVMNMGTVANFHLIFNLTCTLLFLPFRKQLVRVVERLVPGDSDLQELSTLDERFFASPGLALEHAHDTVVSMGQLALENYRLAVDLLNNYDPKAQEQLNAREASLDKMEEAVDDYLMKLSDQPLTPQESTLVTSLLHATSDFERIGDYSVNVSESAAVLAEKGIPFSAAADREIHSMASAVEEAISLTLSCYRDRSYHVALQVEPLEEVVDLLRDDLRIRHVERLKEGICTIEQGAQFQDLLINLERISDHCSNIALSILHQTAPEGSLVRTDIHAYTHALHQGTDPQFEAMFAHQKGRYYDPLEDCKPENMKGYEANPGGYR